MRWAATAATPALFAWMAFADAAPPQGTDILFREFSGTPDVAATDGEAVFRDDEGIYCWWESPEIRPGYFEVIARARTTAGKGALHFTLTDAGDDSRVRYSVSLVQRGVVTSGAYEEIDCGTFYWDGSYRPRLSDWSSPALMLDWVKLRQVAAGDVRDPLPGVEKQYDAPRFASPPEIDGDLSEWVRVPWIHLGEESARSAAYGGSSDLSAAAGFAWSTTHLYFACDVTDDSFATLDDLRALSTLWQYDGVQLAFDAAGDAKGPGYDDNDYEYGFGHTAGGPKAYRWVAGNSLPVGDVPTIDVAVVRDGSTRSTRYEVAIPFKETVPFSPDRPRCGMTWIVNDRDGSAGARAWLEWTPGVASAKDPGVFGTLRLIDAPPAATDVSAIVIVERDLSDRSNAAAEVCIRSPVPLGDGVLRWEIRRMDGAAAAPLVGGETAVTNANMKVSLPVDIPLGALGQGRFVMVADWRGGGDVAASARAMFARFAVEDLMVRLASVRERVTAGMQRVTRIRERGGHGHYPQATLSAVDEFARYTEDDAAKAKYERAQGTLGDLEQLLDEAEREIARIEGDPGADIAVPSLPRARVSARDGTFHCDGEPVLLFGFCGWWEVWAGWDRLAGAGLNHLQDSIIAPGFLFPGGGEQASAQAMDALGWAYERGDPAGICYSRMLASDQVPREFFDHHPGAAGGGWYGMCTLHPAARSFQNRYLTTIAATAGTHPSAGVYILYGENVHRFTDHPLEVAAFAEYLEDEYRTLDALNTAWGTQFRDWEGIGTAHEVASPVTWHDRGRFNHRQFASWSQWLQEQVRLTDPDALCTGYPSLLSWDDSSDFSSGIDMEALCRIFRVNGFDTASLDYGGKRWAMTSITGFAMPHDLVKAFNPKNPNFDPELHLVNVNIPYPDEYIRAAMFQGCFHGMSAANLWVFQRNEGIDSMLVFQPRVMASYFRIGLDLRRLTRAVIAFQQAPSEVAILYAMTSIAFNPDHLPALRAAYEGTFFADTKVGFVTERTITEGALADIKLLLVPAVSHVPEPVARTVADWADAGGNLVLLGDCLVRDHRNRALPDRLRGPACRILPLEEAVDPDRCRAALEPVIEQSLRRPFRAVDAAGEPLVGVEMRTVETPEGRLFYAINMNKQPVTFDLLPRPQATLIDLLGGKTIALPRTMPPLGVMVLRAE